MPKVMDKSLVKVTLTWPDGVVNEWRIHGERIEALTDFLDWAKKQKIAEEKRTEVARRVRAKAKQSKENSMTTSEFDIEGYGRVVVNHNSDWSGEAKIRWHAKGTQRNYYGQEVEFPASLLLELGKRAAIEMVKDELISFLEQLEN